MTRGGQSGPRRLLQLTDVSHRYGEREVLRSVAFALAPGECVALCGDNGSGKSTLLRLACGRELPTSGEVHFAGRPAGEDDPQVRAHVATVMDAGSFYPDLTVREHLTLTAIAHGVAGQAGVEWALAEHGLTEQQDLLPNGLSSGQTQRLLLAAAFVRPHRLLILDEPEQRLDAGGRDALAERLGAHKKTGVAILLATHHRSLAERLADRTLTLTDGLVTDDRSSS